MNDIEDSDKIKFIAKVIGRMASNNFFSIEGKKMKKSTFPSEIFVFNLNQFSSFLN